MKHPIPPALVANLRLPARESLLPGSARPVAHEQAVVRKHESFRAHVYLTSSSCLGPSEFTFEMMMDLRERRRPPGAGWRDGGSQAYAHQFPRGVWTIQASSRVGQSWSWPPSRTPLLVFTPIPMQHPECSVPAPADFRLRPSEFVCEMTMRIFGRSSRCTLHSRRRTSRNAKVLPPTSV